MKFSIWVAAMVPPGCGVSASVTPFFYYFLGLTNLLAHKRAYCLLHYSDPDNPFVDPSPHDDTVIVQPEAPPPGPPRSEEWDDYVDSDCESVASNRSRSR